MVGETVRTRGRRVDRARRWSAALAIGAVLVLPTAASAAASPASAIPTDAVPGELLVTSVHGTSTAQRRTQFMQFGARVITSFPRLTMDLVRFGTSTTPAAVSQATVDALAREPGVVAVQPNYLVHAAFVPNDPDVSQQWALTKIDAFGAWDVNQGSSSTKIAIVDTGIDTTSPDLVGKVVGGEDYADANNSYEDNNGHGTMVAGVAAADTNNGIGVAGMCPNCKLLAVKVLGSNGSGSDSNVISGILWASQNGAQVINLSLAGTASPDVDEAVDSAWAAGAFVSCAAGNNGNSIEVSPAEAPDCFATASTNSTDAKSSFSNYGTWVKGAAPGEEILSTSDASPFYATGSGTSLAAPYVSGLAGLLASSESNAEISNTICGTADQITGTGTDWTCGRINAASALDSIAPETNLQLTPSTPNGTNGWYRSVHVSATGTSRAGSTTIASTRCELNPTSAPTVFSALPTGCAYGGAGAAVTTQGTNTVYAASEDSGGNVGPLVSVSFKLDSTPPTVTLTTPANGALYNPLLAPWFKVNASYECADALSGIASCIGAVSNGSPLSFGPDAFGSHMFTVTATDKAGNTTSVTHTYVLTHKGRLQLTCGAARGAHQRCASSLTFGHGKLHGVALSALLMRGRSRAAKGSATRAHNRERALLTPIRALTPGRYTLVLTRHHKTVLRVAITITQA